MISGRAAKVSGRAIHVPVGRSTFHVSGSVFLSGRSIFSAGESSRRARPPRARTTLSAKTPRTPSSIAGERSTAIGGAAFSGRRRNRKTSTSGWRPGVVIGA
jgi:hypothetical protein